MSSWPRNKERKRATFSAEVTGAGIAEASGSGFRGDGRCAESSALRDSRTARVSLIACSRRSICASSRAIASPIDFLDVAVVAPGEPPGSCTGVILAEGHGHGRSGEAMGARAGTVSFGPWLPDLQ